MEERLTVKHYWKWHSWWKMRNYQTYLLIWQIICNGKLFIWQLKKSLLDDKRRREIHLLLCVILFEVFCRKWRLLFDFLSGFSDQLKSCSNISSQRHVSKSTERVISGSCISGLRNSVTQYFRCNFALLLSIDAHAMWNVQAKMITRATKSTVTYASIMILAVNGLTCFETDMVS